MKELDALKQDIVSMVEELRHTVQEIGEQELPQVNVVSNARDRLRYISSLTEQAAGQTLNAAEAISDRLHGQQNQARVLLGRVRSPTARAFLEQVIEEHGRSLADTREIIQAQAFQDLVGQVVGKMMTMVQRLEDSLVHLIVEDKPDPVQLSGPAVRADTRVSQADVDDLFG